MHSYGEASTSKPLVRERSPLISERYYRKDKPLHRGYGTALPNTTHRGQWKPHLCFLFGLLFGLTFLGSLVLLLMAPGFAQRSFDKNVHFSFDKASILNSTQDQETSVLTMHVAGSIVLYKNIKGLASIASSVFGPVGIASTVLEVYPSPMKTNTVNRTAPMIPMGTILLPSLSLAQDSSTTTFDFITQFTIQNSDTFVEFCKDALASDHVMWQIVGPVSVGVGWLPFQPGMILDKAVILQGMGGLKDVKMISVLFPGPHPLGGMKFESSVSIYNPSSVLSLQLGNIDFGIYLPATQKDEKDVLMATVKATDAKLIAKEANVFNVSGRSMPIEPQGQKRMEKLISTYLHGNTSIVHVKGVPRDPEDKGTQTTPEWLQKTLQAVTLRVPFPGTQHTDLIQSIQFNHLKIDFSKGNVPLISGDANAILKKPHEMQASINVTTIQPLVYLFMQTDSKDPFASLSPNEPCLADTVEKKSDSEESSEGILNVHSRIEKAPFTIMPGKEEDFKKFMEKVFYHQSSTIYFRGVANASIECAFGQLNVSDLPFSGEINTKGMKGMQDPPPVMESMSVIHGYAESIHATSTLSIYNPSDIYVNLGAINVLIQYKNETIGNATLPELILKPLQKNTVSALAWLHHASSDTILHKRPRSVKEKPKPKLLIDFVSHYIENENISLTISGHHSHASSSKILLPLLEQFVFTTNLPKMEAVPLLKATQVNILSSTAILWLRNPFPTINIQIMRIYAKADYHGDEIGTINVDFMSLISGLSGPLILPPCSKELQCNDTETPKLPVLSKKLGFEAIKSAIGGHIEVSVDSHVDVMVDDFLLEDLEYRRDNLTAKVRKGF
ncbi:hypothetical protein BDF14DRAFT_1842686 [Spinellus fusiger]|nr:hypothetical protein BDF14DRAFT_1842686 [Spinellus fusiger]